MTNNKKDFFSRWVEQLPKSTRNNLPLTHITSAFSARSIIDDGELKPFECKRLGKKLVYMFYGAVSYTLPSPKQVTKIMDCPVCFVLNGELVNDALHIYPFDSGAFKDKLFSGLLDEKFLLENFEISPKNQAPAQIIDAIYKNRKSYLVGDTRNMFDPKEICGEGEYEVREYISMLLSQAGSNLDKRISSFEVAFDKSISLDDWLMCVIIPDTLLTSKPTAKWISSLIENDIELLPYNFTTRVSQNVLNHLIETLFIQFCDKEGFLG